MRFTWVDSRAPGRIAQTHRPRAGEGLLRDLLDVRASGADVLVSCLTEAETLRFGLAEEAEVADRVGLEYRRFPIVDHDVPRALDEAVAFADGLAADLAEGRGVVLHCFAGIGRSGLMLIATLVRSGVRLDDAIEAAGDARGGSVPETADQRRWLTRIPPRAPNLDPR